MHSSFANDKLKKNNSTSTLISNHLYYLFDAIIYNFLIYLLNNNKHRSSATSEIMSHICLCLPPFIVINLHKTGECVPVAFKCKHTINRVFNYSVCIINDIFRHFKITLLITRLYMSSRI